MARPSPSSVRCRPGSTRKFLLTVEEMAQISPMCSTMVARDRGTIVNTADQSMPVSTSMLNRWNTLFSHTMGRPIHFAAETVSTTFSLAEGSTMTAMR